MGYVLTGVTVTIDGSEVGELIGVSGPSNAYDIVDTTVFGSTVTQRRFEAGLKEGGECKLDVLGASSVTLGGAPVAITIDWGLSGVSNTTFYGIPYSAEPSGNIGDRMVTSITIKVSAQS